MKKLLLFTFYCIAIVECVNAQKNQASNNDASTVFEINPVGTDIIPQKLQFGSRFKFRFSHVNPFTVDVYSTAKPFNFETPAPAVFTQVQVPQTQASGIGSAEVALLDSKLKQGLGELASAKANVMSYKSWSATPKSDLKLKELENKVKELQKKVEALTNELNAYLSNDFGKNYNDFIADYQTLQKMVCAEDTLFKMIPPVIVPNVDLVRKNARTYMAAIYGSTKSEDYLLNILIVQKRLNQSYAALKKAYEQLNKIPAAETISMSGQLKSADSEIVIALDNSKVVIKQKPKFEDEYKAAAKIFNLINDGDSSTKLFNKAAKGIELLKLIQEIEFESYEKEIKTLDADEITYPLVLKDKKGKILMDFNSVTIKAKGGIKTNFSTGYLLTFIGDENYTPGTVDGKQGLTRQGKSDLTHAIGALAHVYHRSATGFSAGASGGFSLTNTGNVGFYLGASGLFLEKNRLAFTAGLSFTKVNRLNTANLTVYDNNKGLYTFNNSSDIKVNYDSLYKPGFFFGITYNIFSGTETKTTK